MDRKIEPEKREMLTSLAEKCNKESGLHIQIVFDDPKCFQFLLAKVSKFKGCENYIAIAGRKKDYNLDEKAGYYGEKLVLKAQELGLNTCWVGVTHGKSQAEIEADEKLIIVIALGYGVNQGTEHRNKDISLVSNVTENLPDWYARGLEAALLAPAAMNQQKFSFVLDGNEVRINPGKGSYTMLDSGIVKYHFETASGHKVQ